MTSPLPAPLTEVLVVVEGLDAGPFPLAQGDDPARTLADHGLALDEVLAAVLTGPAELTITVRARPTDEPAPPRGPVRRDPDVRDDELAHAVPMRRVAAYALVRHEDRVLLTVLSHAASTAPGAWTMPGGGIDPGEQPADAVVREVWEETGQRVEDLRLLGVTSDRWIGRAPDGRLEDFHPVRLLYSARCPHPTEPVVHDVGGTTASASWVPLPEVLDPFFPLVRSWREVLPRLLGA